MSYLSYLFLFLFGLCVGSFLNVVAIRYGTERSIITARSACPHCGKTLSWFELVPLLSFILQKGRCRNCKTKISFQYPLIEFLTAVVFVIIFWKADFFGSVLGGNIFSSFAE